MSKPNSLSHLTQDECDILVDLIYAYREDIAVEREFAVEDGTFTKEDIDEMNSKMRTIDTLCERLMDYYGESDNFSDIDATHNFPVAEDDPIENVKKGLGF